MSEQEDRPEQKKPGRLRRLWQFVARPSSRWGLGILLLAGFVVGVVFWASFNAVVAYTNTMSFCTSCHVMEAFVYTEYRETPHYSNASGVRVACADCHVPEAFIPKMVAKTRATVVEVPSWLVGTINTEERFEAHRQRLAERVWARMRATDSRECRTCHSWDAMSAEAQAPRAQREHERGRQAGETCIDCHIGVAHKLPEAYLEAPEDDDFDFGF
jgi:cytochrome c-type protein NapC